MAVAPAVENMPGPHSTRPGDVVKAMNGKTVEITNTDAEGRLILGDAFTWAERNGATHLVDVATLTGAVARAFGDQITGGFATPQAWWDEVAAAGARQAERYWQIPLVADYRADMDSPYADLQNSGTAEGVAHQERHVPGRVRDQAVGSPGHRGLGLLPQGASVGRAGCHGRQPRHARGAGARRRVSRSAAPSGTGRCQAMTADPMLLGVGRAVGGAFGLRRGPTGCALAGACRRRRPAHRTGARSCSSLASAVTLALLLGRWPEHQDRVVLGIYLAALMVLAATDLDQRLLPDVITLPLIPFALAGLSCWASIRSWRARTWPSLSALAAGIGAPLLLLLTDRLFGGALGMGDVKLAVSLGLMLGVSRLLAGFLVASIAARSCSSCSSPLRRLSLRSAVPFGPILIAAGVIGMLLP